MMAIYVITLIFSRKGLRVISYFYRVVLISLAIVSPTFAQNFNYQIELLNENNGFASYEIYSIIQDHQGFLWFGTAETGLMRYDGNKVTLFESKVGDPSSLSSNDAGNIMLNNNGDIWIGTWGGGINIYHPKQGDFVEYLNDPQQEKSISSNRVQSLFQDSHGEVWLGTYDAGLNKYLPEEHAFKRFKHDINIKTSLSNNRIWAISEASEHSLWIATSNGLNLYNKQSEIFTAYFPEPDKQELSQNNIIRHILPISSDFLYLGTQNGVLTFDIKNKKFNRLKTLENKIVGKIYSLIEDQSGIIWVGSSTGLYQISPVDNIIHNVKLPFEGSVRIVFEDKMGIIWATSEVRGIYKINTQKNFLTLDNDVLSSPNELLIDFSGDLIIANASAALLKWEKKDNTFKVLNANLLSGVPEAYKISSKNYKPILHQKSEYEYWFAQENNLLRFDSGSGEIEAIKYLSTHKNYSVFKEFRDINSDKSGKVWIGTFKNGLHIYDPSTGEFQHHMPDFSNELSITHAEIHIIYRDRKNRMWVGTGNGLNLWDENLQGFHQFKDDPNNTHDLSGNLIYTIHQDQHGTVWVGTSKGLNRYNESEQKIDPVFLTDGMVSNLIRAITDDDEGHLWLTTSKGLTSYEPESGRIFNYDSYDSYDGLLGANYYSDALIHTNDNLILSSGARGVDYFDPKNINIKPSEANIVLTGFKKMGKEVLLDKPLSFVKSISLDHQDDFFEFEFSILDFYASEKNKYSYKLENFDENWIDIGNKNSASYTNLGGGNYTFKVKSVNGDGIQGSNILSIDLYIATPPWKTWWAYTFYGIFSLLLTFTFIRSQRKKVIYEKRLNAQLESKVVGRTIELRLSNDNLEIANTQLEELSITDQLTGLRNRRFLQNNLKDDVAIILKMHAKANSNQIEKKLSESDLIFFLIDLDHFKHVNDIHGHTAGDEVLIQIKSILEKVFRKSDYLVRWGGEEFLVITRFSNRENAPELAERLRQSVETHDFDIGQGKTLKKTCSIGFACFPFLVNKPDCLVWEQVMGIADHCMYVAKKSSRNAWVGLNNIDCNEKNILLNITENTKELIDLKHLEVESSITDESLLQWD